MAILLLHLDAIRPAAIDEMGRFEVIGGARAAVVHLKTQSHTMPLSCIVQAVYEARAGNLDAARASWGLAAEQQPVLRLYPGAFLATLPASPAVKARMRAWLQPAVPGV